MTGDPHEGGIFWSQQKADERLAVKRSEMEQANREAAVERGKTAGLIERRSALRSHLERQQRELQGMRNEIATLQQQNAHEHEPGATEALEADVARVEQKREALAADQSLPVAEMERQLVNLRAEVARLKKRKQLLMESRQ